MSTQAQPWNRALGGGPASACSIRSLGFCRYFPHYKWNSSKGWNNFHMEGRMLSIHRLLQELREGEQKHTINQTLPKTPGGSMDT